MIIMFTARLFPYLLSNDDSACCHPAKVTVILCACAYLCVCNSLNAVCGKTSCVCGTCTHTHRRRSVWELHQYSERRRRREIWARPAWWWWLLLLLLLNIDHVKDLMLREAWTLVMFCFYLDLLVHVKQRAKAGTHHRITELCRSKSSALTLKLLRMTRVCYLAFCSDPASFRTCFCVYLHLWGHLCKLFANHFVSMWSFCIFLSLYA